MRKTSASLSLPWLIILAFAISSCSIQSRKYLKGYDVNWRFENGKQNAMRTNNSKNANKEKISRTKQQVPMNKLCMGEGKMSDDKITRIDSSDYSNKQTSKKKFSTLKTKLKSPRISQFIQKKNVIDPTNPVEPIENKQARLSMLFAAFAFGLFLMGIVPGFALMLLLALGVLLAELFGILAVVNGTKARREIKTHPQKYTGRGLANIGFLIGWLMIPGAILVLMFSMFS